MVNNDPTKFPKPKQPPASQLPKDADSKAHAPQLENKQRNQIILLVVVLVLVAVMLYFLTIRSTDQEIIPDDPLPTEFELSALESVQKRSADYPQVDLEDIGKANPFANR